MLIDSFSGHKLFKSYCQEEIFLLVYYFTIRYTTFITSSKTFTPKHWPLVQIGSVPIVQDGPTGLFCCKNCCVHLCIEWPTGQKHPPSSKMDIILPSNVRLLMVQDTLSKISANALPILLPSIQRKYNIYLVSRCVSRLVIAISQSNV